MARRLVKHGWRLRLQEYDRPNSAYMLFYERADCLEPVTMMDEIAAAAPREAASQAAGVPVADVTTDMSTSSTAAARPAHPHLLICNPGLNWGLPFTGVCLQYFGAGLCGMVSLIYEIIRCKHI